MTSFTFSFKKMAIFALENTFLCFLSYFIMMYLSEGYAYEKDVTGVGKKFFPLN